ncbi:MAG: 2-oxoacid:acceptor oxidoreductase subunit alpha [Xanthomonadales bacterium]|nr:2-oxoacid:acceptor oxidoreductase subunit alpha [Xanthomonadales bacterium]
MRTHTLDDTKTLSIAVVGSGGAGAMTTGNLLLEACAKLGSFGLQTRSVGPQIRGGEAAAMVRLSSVPVDSASDRFDILLAMDWNNVDRFASEIPTDPDSLIICDPAKGEIPAAIARAGAQVQELPISELAKQVKKGRGNMIALGVIAEIIGLSQESIEFVLTKKLAQKGEEVLKTSLETVAAGRLAAVGIDKRPVPVAPRGSGRRWIISGNEAMGLGALRGGIRFVAAYPITPATEILEWMAPKLPQVGGALIQAEDELASINMAVGASFGGIPSMTATSGPGLALMMESLGLAVSSETPLVVVDVMRGGPSTGIPTTSEQTDLNIAVYGLHGEAPHLVLAPISVADCLFTGQWSVVLAEALQVPAIVLSDQFLGQANLIIDEPVPMAMQAERATAAEPGAAYQRYALTESGVSPMSVPGTPGGQYTATGLEHTPTGLPSSTAENHSLQLDKRSRKITEYDYGDYWAELEGEGDHAVITWGSTTGPVREAMNRLRREGVDKVRTLAIRLLAPVQPEKFAAALAGVKKVLVIEQSHSGQFNRYLSAHYSLPEDRTVHHRAGPLLMRADELVEKIRSWSQL